MFGRRLCFPVLVLWFAAGDGSGGAFGQNGPDPHFAKAVELQNQGKIEEALQEYDLSLQEGPRMEVLVNSGALLARLGRYEEAINRYTKALELSPGHPMILLNLGLAHYKAIDLKAAIDIFQGLISKDPGNVRLHTLVADCYFQLGDYQKVISQLAPVASSHPDDLSIAYLLGSAYIRDHQVEKGEALIQKIMEKGESAEAHLMMGTILGEIYHNKDAIAEYERAIQMNPSLPGAHAGLAFEILRSNEVERALKEFEAELAVNPNDYMANFYMGYLKRRDREYEDALAYLNRAARLRPGDGAALLQIAIVHYLQEDLDKAQAILEDVIKNDPKFMDAYVQLARVYFKKKMTTEGREAQRKADELKREIESQKEATGGKATVRELIPNETRSESNKP